MVVGFSCFLGFRASLWGRALLWLLPPSSPLGGLALWGLALWGFQFVSQLCFALCSLPCGLGSFASLTPPNAKVRSLIPLAYKL
nr:MAG TPA: hypothetical protein [Caudoviricetes sp.]